MTTSAQPHGRAGTRVVRAVAERAAHDRRRVWNLLAVLVVWGTSLIVCVLWVHGGGVQAVGEGGAAALNGLGRITGLVSANLLLYQVLLMARVPLFERGFGRDGITRLHRLSGFWSFWLLLAHIALLVAGYAMQDGINPFVQLWQFVWDYPGMLLATVATGLLVLVVVTSVRRARRRLRYESWHLLHLYGYLGAGLAVPHMLWTGADFAQPITAVYWWTLWAVAAASVVVFRIVVPLWRSARHVVRVRSVERDGRSGVLVRMRGRDLARLDAQAGQFFVWRFLAGPGWMRGHPFSLAEAPQGDTLVIAARQVGDGTERLARLRPGTRVLLEGPFGTLTGARRHGAKVAMFGAGAGVAPLVALLQSEPYAPGDAVLVTRDSADADLLRAQAIADLVARRGLRHYTLNGPRQQQAGWLPASHGGWRGDDIVHWLLRDASAWDVYLCGPPPWMASLRADLRDAGVPADRIHSEAFTV